MDTAISKNSAAFLVNAISPFIFIYPEAVNFIK